ncbi:ParB/RepB/Spo0J family partition protein [Caulobacter sp. DWR3-1-2]|uniref:ParB/RepB/Spo0J family partition protein n=1 Tax=Caulobacter sp. DWR3-1-2 TaxID=2804647 RepID=UPI003CEDA3AC
MNALTPLAVSAESLLRAIQAGGFTSNSDLAAKAGRMAGNISRDLGSLEKEGLITRDPLALTPAALAALEALDRANGVTSVAVDANAVRPPEGHAHLFHRQIRIGGFNPRKKFDKAALEELSADIAERGLKTNLEVREADAEPDAEGLAIHQLVAGERRWRAIGLAIERGDLDRDFPILVKVEAIDDAAHEIGALLENLQREDLTPLEEAEAFERIMKRNGWNTAQMAEKAKRKSREFVQQRLRLLKLTDVEKRQMEDGQLTVHDALKRIAARPKPLELTTAEALMLGEIVVYLGSANNENTTPSWWQAADCAAAIEADPLAAALVGRGLLAIEGPTAWHFHHQVKLASHDAWSQIKVYMPGVFGPEGRDTALLAIQASAVGADLAEQANTEERYLTPWLNGPFELTPEGQAFVDAKAEKEAADAAVAAEYQEKQAIEYAERKAKQHAAGAEGQAFLAAVRNFEFRANVAIADGLAFDFSGHLREALEAFGFKGPFKVALDGDALVLNDVEGKLLAWAPGPGFEALRRIQALALNHALGAPLFTGPDLKAPTDEVEATPDDLDDGEGLEDQDDDDYAEADDQGEGEGDES